VSPSREPQDRPLVGLDCSFGLYFPAEKVGPVLLEIARLAAGPAGRRTNLVLPDGCMVTVPFSSWLGEGKTIPLLPVSRVRLDVSLRFPPAAEDPDNKPVGPVAIRLWVYMGHEHAGFVFFPPGPRTGRLLVESDSIHRTLARLLERHGGIVGMLDDIDHDTSYLLPDLRRRIDLPELTPYYDANQGIDVDPWLEALLRPEAHPTLPPCVPPPEKVDDLTDEAMRTLETMLGSSREPVPARYQRTFEERPFDTCDFCGAPLLVPGRRYTVIKLYSAGELRQEMALCSGCGRELRKGYSAESEEAMAQIFAQVPVARRAMVAADEGADRMEKLAGRCVLCDLPREEAKTHVEYALCEANEIVYSFHPFAVCDDCIVRIYDALSQKTKDAERRFYDDHFGFPPPGTPSLERVPERLPVWVPL
jgi:hypothetical protein